MSFRITPGHLAQRLIFANQKRTATLARLQNQATTGLRLERASDDPLATKQLFALNRTINDIGTENTNINNIEHTLNLSVTTLQETHDIINSAKRIALQARNSTDESDRTIFAIEVDRLLERLVDIGNATDRGRYIYSGKQNSTRPFAENSQGGFPRFPYAGSADALSVTISQSIQIDVLYSGKEIFGSTNRLETLFLGETGATAGTGTDNGISQGQLTVIHGLTTYEPAAGITAGPSSASGDTVIGQSGTHNLRLVDTSGTGATGTISLNGGPTFDWKSTDGDLRVTGPFGEVIFVDTSAIVAGFSGNVEIESTGSLSTDGGLTTIPIDFSGNQSVTNSQNSTVTNVNSSGIRHTGVDQVEYIGTSDVFSTLVELRDDLRNSRGLDNRKLFEAFGRRDSELERHAEQVLGVLGEQSVSLESINAIRSRNEDYRLEIASSINELESADLSEVVIRLQTEQDLLQFSYSSFAVVLSQNILDFLR